MKVSDHINFIKEPDSAAVDRAKKRWLNIAKPLGSFGLFEDMIIKIAAITGNEDICLDKKAVIIMCADNGIVNENVTQTGQHMTRIVAENIMNGDASICHLAKIAGAEVIPIDIGIREDVPFLTDPSIKVRKGTGNIAVEDAMTREEAERAVLIGIDRVRILKESGVKLIATGEMGIGNTAVSSAISAFLLDVSPELVTGKGAGLSDEGLKRKIAAVNKAIALHMPDRGDSIDVLRCLGGLDIAALTGVFIGGAVFRVPIVIDGFISAVAALLAFNMDKRTVNFMLPSHVSKESGASLIFDRLKLDPVICAGMFNGEGTGALMLFPLLDMALDVYNNMVTFDNWKGGERYRPFQN